MIIYLIHRPMSSSLDYFVKYTPTIGWQFMFVVGIMFLFRWFAKKAL